MTEKQKYWLSDSTGTKCLVVGADERARWAPRGWFDADEPAGSELVWVAHPDVELPAKLPWDALQEGWSAKGWAPSAPIEPVDPLTGVRPPAPVPMVADEPAETESKTPSRTSVKEKDRG